MKSQVAEAGRLILSVPLVAARTIAAPPLAVRGMIRDVASMSAAVQTLPAVATRLATIERHVLNLDDEVASMRQGVEAIRGEVLGVGGSVAPLEAQLAGVRLAVDPLDEELERMRATIACLEPPLVDVREAIVPLRPTAERLAHMLERLPRARRRGQGGERNGDRPPGIG